MTLLIGIWSCTEDATIKPDYILSADKKHNKFSKLIPPVLKVSSGAVIKAITNEASDGQLHKKAKLIDLINIDFGPIHPLTGPVYVEEAEVGDILAVDLIDIELHDYGWQAIVGGFGFLTDRFPEPKLNVHTIDIATKKAVNFMVDHLSENYDISAEDAYMLCSLVGDLKIAEVVDVPNMLVTMHFPKSILDQL